MHAAPTPLPVGASPAAAPPLIAHYSAHSHLPAQYDYVNEEMGHRSSDDGTLSAEQFLASCAETLSPASEGGPNEWLLRKIFARFDVRGVGSVTVEEVRVQCCA